MDINFSYLGLAIPPVVIGLMELAKLAGLPKRLVPYVNVILSVLFSTIYLYPDSLKQGIFVGLIISLSSMGLYNGAKSTVKTFIE
jgi:hypothetical protein